MRTTLLLLALGSLALLASCVEGVLVPGDPLPLEILHSNPEGDSLVISDRDSLVFMVTADGSGPLSTVVLLEEQYLGDGDSLLFRAWEHVELQSAMPDSYISLEIRVTDSLEIISRRWELKILYGFSSFPGDSDIGSVLGQSVMFQVGLETGGMEADYCFYVDGDSVGNAPIYYHHSEIIGQFEILGRVSVGDLNWTRAWTLEVQPGDPVDPPETVTNLRAGPGSVPGNLIVAFSPPEEGLREPVHSYEIRAHTHEVDDWESAYLIAIVPKTPGAQEERFDLPALSEGLELIIRVRSIGVGGNTSIWSERAYSRVAGYSVRGTLLDFETGLGKAGIGVEYGDVSVFTDAEGRFFCDDVPYINSGNGGVGFPGIYSDESESDLGEWFDLIDTRAVVDSVDYRMGSFRPEPFESVMYRDFFEYFVWMVRPPEANFHLIRPHFPLLTYIPEYTNEGLNYTETCIQGMDIWESTTQLDFFERVDNPEDATLTFVFDDTTSVTGICKILAWDQTTLTPLELEITLDATAVEEYQYGLYQVVFHELGHAIGFWRHSNDMGHCMNHSNLQAQPHPDEIRLARILYHMECYEDLGFLRDGRVYDYHE